MSLYQVTYWSASKRRDYMIEELNDSHLLNAERKLAAEHPIRHIWAHETDDTFGGMTVKKCHLCGVNQVSSEDSECPRGHVLLEALRSEILRRGLHEPKPETPTPEAQDIDWGKAVS